MVSFQVVLWSREFHSMILRGPSQLECVEPGFVPTLSLLCQACAEPSGLEMERGGCPELC